MEQEFTIDIQRQDDITVIKLSGFLDANTISQFEEAIEKEIGEKRYKIITDLSDLNYISSAGLGVYMGYVEDIRAENGDIKLCCLTEKIYKVFDLLGFPELFDIEDSLDECIEKFNKADSQK